jgi:hypothetical protein
VSLTPALAAFKLAFQLSPIILTNGVAALVPGGMLPVIAITEALNFPLGLLSGGENIQLDDFFANYEPLPGSNLIAYEIGHYPFANQAVAANAVIAQPLKISLRMNISIRQPGGYPSKLVTMTALKSVLDQHITSGGTFTVATPTRLYTNCLLIDLADVSDRSSKQVQNTYQWDFEQPLLTLAQAQQSLNNLLGKIASGVPTDGSLSGASPNVATGASPGPTAATVPVATPLTGAGVSGLSGNQ